MIRDHLWKGPLPDTHSAGALTLNVSTARTVRNTFSSSIKHVANGIFFYLFTGTLIYTNVISYDLHGPGIKH